MNRKYQHKPENEPKEGKEAANRKGLVVVEGQMEKQNKIQILTVTDDPTPCQLKDIHVQCNNIKYKWSNICRKNYYVT
jgi:hypothetical protein